MSEKTFKHHAENEEIHVDYNFHPGCVVEMNVLVTPKASSAAYHKAVKEIRKEVSLPGFRKGKVPDDILSKHFSTQIEENFSDVLQKVAFKDASELIKKPPFSRYLRKANVKKKARDGSSEIYFEYESTPTVPEVDITTINLEHIPPTEPSEKEIDLFLLRLRFAWSKKTQRDDRPIQEDDAVSLSLKATIDGVEKTIEPIKELLVTKILFPEWLYAAVLGMKKGETKKCLHPQEKNTDGTPVEYTILVDQISECDLLPEDDAFAAKWHYESIAKFREATLNMLRAQYKTIAQDKMRRQLRNELIRLYAFDLPQSLVEAETEGRYRAYLESKPHPAGEKPDRETERKPFMDNVKRHFTCLYLLMPFFKELPEHISNDELIRELEHQSRELPYTQRSLLPNMNQEEVVRRLATSISLRRAEDYCIRKILGIVVSHTEKEEHQLEEHIPEELRASMESSSCE